MKKLFFIICLCGLWSCGIKGPPLPPLPEQKQVAPAAEVKPAADETKKPTTAPKKGKK